MLEVVSVTEAEMVSASVTSATSGTPTLTVSVLETPIVEAAGYQINNGMATKRYRRHTSDGIRSIGVEALVDFDVNFTLSTNELSRSRGGVRLADRVACSKIRIQIERTLRSNVPEKVSSTTSSVMHTEAGLSTYWEKNGQE